MPSGDRIWAQEIVGRERWARLVVFLFYDAGLIDDAMACDIPCIRGRLSRFRGDAGERLHPELGRSRPVAVHCFGIAVWERRSGHAHLEHRARRHDYV